MAFQWLSSLMIAVAIAAVAIAGGNEKKLPFDRQGDSVRVTATPEDGALLVVGSTGKSGSTGRSGSTGESGSAGGSGKLVVTTHSASFSADSELTVYRLVPVGRWTPGQGGIRCNPRFTDCPLPPPPIPPHEPVQTLVKGLP